MFYYLNGTVTHIEGNLAVLDVNGVGYACITSLNTLSKIELSKSAKLYTYLHVREDIFDLYGFFAVEELSCFKLLIGISGVGPKAAISILSSISPENLAICIMSGDDKPLTRAQGIGKKLAMRIILELKDKITKESAMIFKNDIGDMVSTFSDSNVSEAVAALSVLGYSHSEAAQAVSGIATQGMPVEEIIKAALKSLSRLRA